jgi:trehalose synthase
VGVDVAGQLARSAWNFLHPDVDRADAVVFSRKQYVWDGLAPDRVVIMAPCIDVLSPKNHPIDEAATRAILHASRIVPGGVDLPGAPTFTDQEGTNREVRRRVEMIEGEPLPSDARLVVQVSRWDRLKDPVGVIRAFLTYGGPADAGAHLVVAGPATDSVADDPESTEAFEDVRSVWEQLDARWQSQVHLARLPMDDADENSAIVNALQRRADVVVQKSLAEGFGLTVAEAMWKDRPVVASRVGGIQDQIVDRESGVLVDDPRDVDAFGRAVAELLAGDDRAKRMGAAARQRVCDQFLPRHHFAAEAELLERVKA